MKDKFVTVAEIREFAMENYNNGGDGLVECMTDDQILQMVSDGVNTRELLLKSFRAFEAARFEAERA